MSTRHLLPALAALSLLLGACSGGALVTLGGTGGNTQFMSYSVDVTSVVLNGSDGSTKQVLSQTTRVDLADPERRSLALAAPSTKANDYIGGTVTIDYSNADVILNLAGVATQATLVDINGAALTQVQIPIRFDSHTTLDIDQTKTSQLALNLDLPASDAINALVSPAQVVVRPVAAATINPSSAPLVELSGTINKVDSTSAFTVALTLPNSDTFTVHGTDSTVYEIDGATYLGNSGLTAIANIASSAQCIVRGQIVSGAFQATQVLAGGSIAGGTVAAAATTDSTVTTTNSQVSGTVIARSANALTVRGVRLANDAGDVQFYDVDASVLFGSGTLVNEEGIAGSTFLPGSVSIGQRIVALGAATTDSAGNVSLDATSGIIRLESTVGWGLVKSTASGTTVVNLQLLDSIPPSILNFAGTQAGSGTADATAYQVATGSLDLTGMSAGSETEFSGVVAPFAAAPPNFDASAINSAANAPAEFLVRWTVGGGAAVLTTLSATEIVINPASGTLAADHRITVGPQVIDLAGIVTSPPLMPDGSVSGQFSLQTLAGAVTVYSSFAEFTAALKAALTGSTGLATLSAQGRYDSGSFLASEVVAQLQ